MTITESMNVHISRKIRSNFQERTGLEHVAIPNKLIDMFSIDGHCRNLSKHLKRCAECKVRTVEGNKHGLQCVQAGKGKQGQSNVLFLQY
jgi:hypothetical protein